MGNRFVYAQLQTTDVAGAKTFYAQLFGWAIADDPPSAAPPYAEISDSGERIAGLMAARPGAPAQWMPYISVDDLDASAGQAVALGATLVMPPTDIRVKNCRVCVLTDPAGAVFALRGPLQT